MMIKFRKVFGCLLIWTAAILLILVVKHMSDIKFLQNHETELPWYFRNGTQRPLPTKSERTKLLPNENPQSDRIIDQLMFVPSNYEEIKKSKKLKSIYTLDSSDTGLGQNIFKKWKCPVDTCEISNDATNADMIFTQTDSLPDFILNSRKSHQIFMLYLLECPRFSNSYSGTHRDIFNWTSTYRFDSDIVAPYEKFVYYDSDIKSKIQNRNYAVNKTKKVAWFVSNCNPSNLRMQYAEELKRYINVDIFGECGNLSCPRGSKFCDDILDNDYKFYLSFENSHCRDYITEKFFLNGLKRDIVPIAMGAKRSEYERVSPLNSFIHVDDFESPKHLAEYLHKLDSNDDLYNEYFKWKGTGEFIHTYFWCRVCAMLHDDYSLNQHKNYFDMTEWWGSEKNCFTNQFKLNQ